MAGKISDFTIIKKLGDGAYSSVFKVRRHDDNDIYALKKVKMLSLSEKEKENALNEVRILASFDHPNVIAYRDSFIDEPSSSLCLVMEYADNGDVFQKICNYQKRETYIKEKKIWYVFIQIVRGLLAFHGRKILHRDMKSANIFLFKDMQAKLGDLNVSKIVKKGLSYTQTGTPYYASPEVWRDMPYDSKSDIWSLGCVLYEMCALVPPFRADDMQGLYKKVIKGKYPRIPDHFSQEMATVIKFMLQISPSYRPSCDQILALPIVEALSKKFFPEERNKVDTEEERQDLLKTIRISRNLFSLTERLPKNKYRGKSNDLLRNNSVDSTGQRMGAMTNQPSTNMLKIKQIANAIDAESMDSPSGPQGEKGFSRKDHSRPNNSGGEVGSDEEMNQENLRRNRDGTISKPRAKRGSEVNNNNRTPTLDKEKQTRADQIRRKLTQSPSVVNIPTHAQPPNSDMEGNDDDQQPMKPTIDYEQQRMEGQNIELPNLEGKHRQMGMGSLGGKKGSVNVVSDNRLLNENDSQNSNSYGQLPRNESIGHGMKGQGGGMSQPRGSVGPRVISKVRGEKVMHVYQNANNKQSVQVLYGGANRESQGMGAQKLMNNPMQARRNKSTVRGAPDAYNYPQPGMMQNQQMPGNQGIQGGLKRNNSKPQLQLPEIGGVRQDVPGGQDSRSQRLVSARANKHAHLSPISQAVLDMKSPQNQGRNNMSPDRAQHILDVIDRKGAKQYEKMQNDLTKIYMMQVDNKGGVGNHPAQQQQQQEAIKKPRDGEWGTLPANAMRNPQDLSPMMQGSQNQYQQNQQMQQQMNNYASQNPANMQQQLAALPPQEAQRNPQPGKMKVKQVRRGNQNHPQQMVNSNSAGGPGGVALFEDEGGESDNSI